MRVLITGAAGRVGTVLVQGLRDRHQLRGFDRAEMPHLEDAIVGDLADLDACQRATEGMEAVIHLGARGGVASAWEDVLTCNIVGTCNIFEAARQSAVPRLAFASRAGLLSAYPRSQQRTVEMYPRPEDYYSVSKVFGVSDSDWPLYDVEHGRRTIGYEPRDRSQVPEAEREMQGSGSGSSSS